MPKKCTVLTPWKNAPISPEGLAGFVYIITCLVNGKKYIGRKYYWRSLRKKVTGKSRRKKVVEESDWQYYKSSSKHVHEDISAYGINNFHFEILHSWKTRAEVNEAEVQEQFSRNVLREQNEHGEYVYYNESILSKFYRKQVVAKPAEFRRMATERAAEIVAASKAQVAQAPTPAAPAVATTPATTTEAPAPALDDKLCDARNNMEVPDGGIDE